MHEIELLELIETLGAYCRLDFAATDGFKGDTGVGQQAILQEGRIEPPAQLAWRLMPSPVTTSDP